MSQYVQLMVPNLGITYRGGWCQLASEASTGQSNVYSSAYYAWVNNVQHTGLPPAGFFVPVYLNMPNGPKDSNRVQQDDVAWSCPDGTVAAAALGGSHVGLFKYRSLQAYIDDYSRNNGGATYRGWGEYVGRIKIIQGDQEVLIQNTPAWKTRMSQVLWEITGEQLSGAEFNSWVGAEPFSIVQALIDDRRRAAQNDQVPTTPDSRLEMLKKILGEANQLINQ